MEVLSSDYTIADIKDATQHKVPVDSLLLWVWHADKIPPHIGISVNDRYFSLKANGKDENLSISTVESIIHRKKIKTLCFELKKEISINGIEEIYENYQQTQAFEITCLAPIKDILKAPTAFRLIGLLEILYSSEQIKNVFGYYIDDDFSGIKNYSTDAIHSRLLNLQ